MKCLNCNKKIEYGEDQVLLERISGENCHFCCQKCRDKGKAFLIRAEKYVKLFLILIIALTVSMPFTAIMIGEWTTYVSLGGFGLVIAIFPFCTPQTVELLGLQKSKWLGRALGIVVMVLPLFMWISDKA